MLFNITSSHIGKNVNTMFVSIIRYVEGKPGRYVIDWRHLPSEDEDKGYFMMGLIRRWTDEEIMILFKFHDNLKKAAKILDRSYGAVRVKWSEIRKKLGLKGKACVKCMVFPDPDISLRMEVVEKLLPRVIEVSVLLLDDCKEMLVDRELMKKLSVKEKVWITRILSPVYNFVEKCQTGKEHLEIYKDEEHLDQPEED